MNKQPLLSLCIPTYGILEWVKPVLESIYKQNCDQNLFEVIITDNGSNDIFKDYILNQQKQHLNLHYAKTTAYSFVNEIEAYKRANGIFIKFINHRTLLNDGSISAFLDFVKKYQEEKPIIYFSNGVLKHQKPVTEYNNFNDYISALGVWSSWSTGMGFWKDDFDKIPVDTEYNELFPHTNILFAERKRSKYIIDDTYLLDELKISSKNKGKYDLFYAFAVEYPALLLDLQRHNDISLKTFLKIKKDILVFVTNLYWTHIIKKVECSYDVSNFNNSIKVFYSKKHVYTQLFKTLLLNKIKKIINW